MSIEQQSIIEQKDSLNAQLQLQNERIRQETIEECAKVCEKYVDDFGGNNVQLATSIVLAKLIRSLTQGAEQQEQSVHQAVHLAGVADACQSHGSVPCANCDGTGGFPGEVVVYPESGPEMVGGEKCEVCNGTGNEPRLCPITRREFFMNIEHPEFGYIPTYGGPFDSYSAPYLDDDGDLRVEHYDHDRGDWIEGGTPLGFYLTAEQPEDLDLPYWLERQQEAVKRAMAATPGPMLRSADKTPTTAGQPNEQNDSSTPCPPQAEQQEQSVHVAGGKLDGAVACQSHGSLPAILEEAAAILNGEKDMRFPIVDELVGFALMLKDTSASTPCPPSSAQGNVTDDGTRYLGELAPPADAERVMLAWAVAKQSKAFRDRPTDEAFEFFADGFAAGAAQALNRSIDTDELDTEIERLALKHVAPHFGKIGPKCDYKKTEQFRRLKAFAADFAKVAALPSSAPIEEREAFEKWADSLELDLSRVDSGCASGEVYSDCNTDYAWLAWQAALSAPAIPEGFSREDLQNVADALYTCYERTINVGDVEGVGDTLLESTTAYAARFIRAMLAAAQIPASPIQEVE